MRVYDASGTSHDIHTYIHVHNDIPTQRGIATFIGVHVYIDIDDNIVGIGGCSHRPWSGPHRLPLTRTIACEWVRVVRVVRVWGRYVDMWPSRHNT